MYEDGAKVIYRYDNSGALAQVEDYATGILTKYMYDLSDRLMMYEEEAGEQNHRVRYYYDSMNNLTKVREGFDGVNRTTTYTYDKDNRVTGVAQSDTSEAYTYDDYGRFRKAALTHGENLTIEDIYTYQAPTDTTTAMQVYKQTTKINGAESAYRYTYDANGNITSVNDGTYTTTYVYDSANQLLRENNQKAGKTWGWTYDDGGNIRSKKEYAYTTGTPGTALGTTEYSYSASSWGDLLISHDGNTIVSDDSGNMLSYGDEKTFTWKHGRELSGMTDDSGSWTFEYNADGLRVYRSNGTDTYKYYYNGDKLTRMVVNGQNITFGYDANGTPQYVLYDGNRYFYLTNLQGDVTAIVSVNGNIVVEYTYDAWGNVLSIEGVRKDNLGKLNPLRYRGYVYDEETGLYYLQSRYYDPQIGRFINADDTAYLGFDGTLLSYNLFTYCKNNPVDLSDENGNDPIAAAAIGGAVAGSLISVTSYLIGAGDDAIFGEAALAFICGALGGALGGAAGMATGDVKFACLVGVAVVGGLYSDCTGGSFLIGSTFAFLGAYAGTKLDTSMFTGFDLAAANYGTAVLAGFPAEVGSQVAHSVWPEAPAQQGNNITPPAENGRRVPHNYVIAFDY